MLGVESVPCIVVLDLYSTLGSCWDSGFGASFFTVRCWNVLLPSSDLKWPAAVINVQYADHGINLHNKTTCSNV